MGILDDLKKKALELKKKEAIKAIKDRGNSFTGKTGKTIISSTETVTINSKTNAIINEVKEGVSAINKTANGDCEKLIAYIEAQGTEVYRINNASKLLEKIKEHTGFITELEGAKAVYINNITDKGMGIKTTPMFIISNDKELDYYMLLREFYLWYSMKKGLDGFDFKSQELFKQYMNTTKAPDTKKLKYEELAAYKEALHRDEEANAFVMDIIRQKEGGANVLKKMQDGGAEI